MLVMRPSMPIHFCLERSQHAMHKMMVTIHDSVLHLVHMSMLCRMEMLAEAGTVVTIMAT
jgi:hypothetical protein